MTRRSFGRKQLLESLTMQKEQKEPRFEWIQTLAGDFLKTVEKPIEIRQTIMKNSELQRCLQHNIIFSIYCTICRKILCASCMYSNHLHRKHRVIPIESATEQIRQDLKTFEAKIPRIVLQSDGIMNANSDFLVRMQRDYNPIQLKIQEFYEGLRQLIKNKEKEQLNYLKERREGIRNEISAYNKELGRINQYVAEKYKSYANANIKPELLIPSRNILENLLAAAPFIQETTLDLDKFRFSIDVDKIKTLQEDIAYRVTNLLPTYEENLPSTKGRTRSQRSLGKQMGIQMAKGKKVEKTSLDRKRMSSSIAGGARTNRKF